MDQYDYRFVTIVNNKCPLYKLGDEFRLSGRALSLMGKSTCMTLMEDIRQTLSRSKHIDKEKPDNADFIHLFNCSGKKTACEGVIRLRYQREKRLNAAAIAKREREYAAVAKELKHFPIFKKLSELQIKDIVSYFRFKQFTKGQHILTKNEPGVKLYIILSGRIEVLGDHGVSIADLIRGDVFGEMSLLTGNPVSSTVRAAEKSKIMYVNGNYFRVILNRFPVLQMYFAQILVERLAKSNNERARQFSKGMAGSLSEITPAELVQTLNTTQKTGVLNLNLSKGNARISVREGEIVKASYNSSTGEAAFFEILKEDSGSFKFEPGLTGAEMRAEKIGDFMYLLMEGLHRMDEDSIIAVSI
jgi:CRP/FNR family transcriptional regulator, cyclic AMP receptor protein